MAPRSISMALSVVALATPLLSCGGVGEPVQRAIQPIKNGAESDGDAAVVGLVYAVGSKQVIGCTGSVVAAERVITAAHCVTPMAPEAILVGTSLAEGTVYPLRRIVVHPDYDRESLHFDVALLELRSPTSVAPLSLDMPRETFLQSGEVVRLVGFGKTDSAAPPRRRTGLARVREVSERDFAVEPAPALSCSGDSGGPALVRDGDGERWVGIASRGDWNCSDHATYTHVAAAIELLEDESEPAGDSCALAPRAPRGHSGWALFAVAFAAWLRRRRA